MMDEIWLSYQMVVSLLGANGSLRLKETLIIKWRGIRLDLSPKGLARNKELIIRDMLFCIHKGLC